MLDGSVLAQIVDGSFSFKSPLVWCTLWAVFLTLLRFAQARYELLSTIISWILTSVFNAKDTWQLQWSRVELRKLQVSLRGISAQDEFAKWARTRRQLDAKQAEVDQLQGKLARSSAAISVVTAALHRGLLILANIIGVYLIHVNAPHVLLRLDRASQLTTDGYDDPTLDQFAWRWLQFEGPARILLGATKTVNEDEQWVSGFMWTVLVSLVFEQSLTHFVRIVTGRP